MKKRYDAKATIGKYRNAQGEEKKRYITVGAVFEDDQGRMSLKIDAVPCSPEWSGWIAFYEPNQEGYQQRPAPQQSGPSRKAMAPVISDEEDEIPF